MLLTTTKIVFILSLLYLIIGLTNYRVEWVDKLYITLYKTNPPENKEYTTFGILLFTLSIFIYLFHFLIGG